MKGIVSVKHLLLIALLLFACTRTPTAHLCDSHDFLDETSPAPVEGLGTAQLALETPNPIAFRRNGGSGLHGRGALFEALECATSRLRVAVCIDIDITINPYSHMVRWENASEMPNGSAGHLSGSSSWLNQRILISDGLPPNAWCNVVTHEMVHVLRRSNAHPGPQYGMSYPVTYSATATSVILQEDINLICAKQTCGCQIPETLPS